eukprot:TRINITY_DN1606_c0_g2_i4.p4 TRINITY_DN1606_c0_g2~~TRINITY_DN1606_c0_g2_i4.p4  ORF type:complete len:116 (+),score=1.30 TRINITY_DN1606_c0_g2_i4:492-839(+)
MYKTEEVHNAGANNSFLICDMGDGFSILTVLYQCNYINCVGDSQITLYAYGTDNGHKQVVRVTSRKKTQYRGEKGNKNLYVQQGVVWLVQISVRCKLRHKCFFPCFWMKRVLQHR